MKGERKEEREKERVPVSPCMLVRAWGRAGERRHNWGQCGQSHRIIALLAHEECGRRRWSGGAGGQREVARVWRENGGLRGGGGTRPGPGLAEAAGSESC